MSFGSWWDQNIGTPVKRFMGGEVREAKKTDEIIREENEGLITALETGRDLTPGERLILVQQGINLGEIEGQQVPPPIDINAPFVEFPYAYEPEPAAGNKHLLQMQAEALPNISINQVQTEINENPMITGEPIMTVDLDQGKRYTDALLLFGAGYLLLKVMK